jgi:murein DD-endopeptidase MepM/ murein hydrolase activator NlpD
LRRKRPHDGLIVTIASDDPLGAQRTFRLSARSLAQLRFGALLLALLALLTGALVATRALQLGSVRRHVGDLERTLVERDRELAMSRSQLDDASYATSRLLTELSSVGALVREVQSVAGLEPNDGPSVAALAPAPRAALGGPDGAGPTVSSVDAVLLDFDGLVAEAAADLSVLTDSLDAVRSSVESRQAEADAVPQLWPVSGWISSQFGWRRSPISGRTLMHKGIDLVAPYRTPIAVSAPGTVVTAGWSDSGYGYRVVVDHGYGFRTLYAHLSEVEVEVGAELALGDTVGRLGSTGFSTGPHLHYEVWHRGVAVDPTAFLPD